MVPVYRNGYFSVFGTAEKLFCKFWIYFFNGTSAAVGCSMGSTELSSIFQVKSHGSQVILR